MISSAKQRFWNLILQFFKRLNGIMLVLHRMSTDVLKSQSMRNNYGNELFHGNLILMFTKDAPSPRLNHFLLYVGFGFRAWPFPGYLASRFTSIESFRLPNLSKFILVASLKFLSNLNFSWKKKKIQSGINFYRNFNQFLWPPATFPMSPICQKEVLPKIALCCNDLPGASFSAC